NPQSVREGLTITLRVFGAGADPLTYQWRKNGAPLADGGRVAGSNSHTLTITNSVIADSGLYDVVLSSPCGPDAATPQAFINVFTCSTADINDDGLLTVQDIFDFLNAYFGSLPTADYNLSGQITVQDIFDFLNAYFAGCT
ncbi:MAG: GC-type dockerin domain-anchored protein, partial [Phycisphaerales bacterium]